MKYFISNLLLQIMNMKIFTLFQIFVVVPLFIFVGYNIFKNVKYSLAVIISILLFGLYLAAFHIYNFYDIFNRMKTKTRYPKEFGILVIMIGVLILGFSIYMYHQHSK